jgi:hypothetical protein
MRYFLYDPTLKVWIGITRDNRVFNMGCYTKATKFDSVTAEKWVTKLGGNLSIVPVGTRIK